MLRHFFIVFFLFMVYFFSISTVRAEQSKNSSSSEKNPSAPLSATSRIKATSHNPTATQMKQIHTLLNLMKQRRLDAKTLIKTALKLRPKISNAKALALFRKIEKERARKRYKVFIFLNPIENMSKKSPDPSLAKVLVRFIRSTLNSLEAVKVKTYKEMPDIAKIMQRYGNFEKMDRVSLIAIKNRMGFDGIIQTRYLFEKDKIHLIISYIDFRNGKIFRRRKFIQLLNSAFFQKIEKDLKEFATTIRRSYRVTLKVSSSPNKAEVFINHRFAGKTPLTKELKSGWFLIEVKARGYKTYRKKIFLKNGDKLLINAVLYNPLAARFLNAAPGFRIDSRELHFGYRYVFLNFDRPALLHTHFADLSYLMRFYSMEVGLRFALGIPQTAINQIDSFAGKNAGEQTYNIQFNQLMFLFRHVLWEKYSFASLFLGVNAGLTFSSVSDYRKYQAQHHWLFAADAYLSFVSRLARARNFSIELQFDLGVAYLGQLYYTEKVFNIFGQGVENQREKMLLGPFGGLTLRLIFWNGIF